MSNRPQMATQDVENFNNWNNAIDVPVLKRKPFVARKIHKLKKMLKFGSKVFRKNNAVGAADDVSLEEWQNHQNSMVEQMQNYENELLEKKFLAMKERDYEHDENVRNENWENWDSCYLCADGGLTSNGDKVDVEKSICYVFMPGQIEPVPVKLRNAKVPGGVMWIVYRPDADICARDDLYSYTTSQIPQAQRPIFV